MKERYSYAQIALHWGIALLVFAQYFTSAAILRVHGYRPLGRSPDPFDLTLHTVHTRVGLVILALVLIRLAMRLRWGAPRWNPPLSRWRGRLSLSVQYGLYGVLIGEAVTGAVAIYLWWPMSVAHRFTFWAFVALLVLHLGGGASAFVRRPRETLFRVTGMRFF